MPQLRKPFYTRAEGSDEDRWTLIFDTGARRLFVEHEGVRGDMRGPGYHTNRDTMDVDAFLNGSGPGQHELVRLLCALLADRADVQAYIA